MTIVQIKRKYLKDKPIVVSGVKIDDSSANYLVVPNYETANMGVISFIKSLKWGIVSILCVLMCFTSGFFLTDSENNIMIDFFLMILFLGFNALAVISMAAFILTNEISEFLSLIFGKRVNVDADVIYDKSKIAHTIATYCPDKLVTWNMAKNSASVQEHNKIGDSNKPLKVAEKIEKIAESRKLEHENLEKEKKEFIVSNNDFEWDAIYDVLEIDDTYTPDLTNLDYVLLEKEDSI